MSLYNTNFYSKREQFDRGTFLGTMLAFALIILAISLGGSISSFLDLSSFLIVVGGTLCAVLVNFPLEDLLKTFTVIKSAFFQEDSSAKIRLDKILELSRRVRLNGHLSLQNDILQEKDPFLSNCLSLIVDGLNPQDIRKTLETELAFLEDRHRRGAQLFQTMGSVAPAMGLIGTLIGLIQMLQHLEDPTRIGPGMSVALITTFYGALLAHLVFLPLAGKLRMRSQQETLIKEMTIEGIVAIAQGTNPHIVQQQLFGFLAPEHRDQNYG